MKLKDFIKNLASRVDLGTDANLDDVVNQLPEFDLNDEVAEAISGQLMTRGQAENNVEIKKKFVAQALNGVDAQVDAVLADIFDEEELEAFKTENKATNKKIAKLIEQAKKLKASSKPGDQNKLAEKVNELNATLAQIKTDHETAIGELKKSHKKDLFYRDLAAKILGRDDVADFGKDKNAKRVLADLEDTLAGLKGVIDYETGKVLNAEDSQIELYGQDNKPWTIDSLLEKTLVDNKYIKKSDKVSTSTITVEAGKGNKKELRPEQATNIQNIASKYKTS